MGLPGEPRVMRRNSYEAISLGPKPTQAPPLQAVIDQWDKTIRYLAYQEARRWGFRTQLLDLEDLVHHGYLHLISLYRRGRIDWSHPGVHGFIRISLAGHLKNTLQSWRSVEGPAFMPSSGEAGCRETREIKANSTANSHEDCMVMRSILKDVQEFVDHLPPRDLLIFASRILDGRSLEAIARVLNTSRESVRRKEKALHSEIQQFLGRKGWELCDVKEFL